MPDTRTPAVPVSAPGWAESSTGLCPACLRTVPTEIRELEGQIWIEQSCPQHGASRALLASSAAEYLRLRQYTPDRSSGCCGGEETCSPAGPPVCVLLLEITQACNLRCPTCYADAHGHDFMPLQEVRRRLDAFFRLQGRLDVLMVSGGEPTIHPDLEAILDLALSYPVGRILVNTNGLRLARDEALAEMIGARRHRVELYFSFASFRPDVHRRLYGRDLLSEKKQGLERARDAGIFVTLVPTVEHGVNDDEIGDLYRFALSMDNINGITYQPVMDTGRYENSFQPERRLTLTGVLQAIETQTAGALRTTDFVALPCSHPDCCVLTYGLLDAKREQMIPLPRHLDVGRYMSLFTDRISFSGMIGSAARRVWSDMAHLRAGRTLKDLAILFGRGGVGGLAPLLGDPEAVGRRVFRIVVKPFMDAHTYDHHRIEQCCTKILDDEGKAISFCEYNVFHRGRTAKDAFVPIETLVSGG